ncbi:MAG TPA: endonuclease/exonuclease/phosphatase family protein [Acidimicrobiales bacterium]|nr:endonuclease/exonuclease/phosphatase family protein [Acidimicrobiales bacterium]
MPSLSLATFNTRWGLDSSFFPYDVAGACRDIDTDVIVMQETWWPDVGTSFVDEAADLGYRAHPLRLCRGGFRRGKPWPTRSGVAGAGWWGLAILSRLPTRQVGSVDLVALRRDPALRGALIVELDVDGAAFTVVGTHLAHLSQGSRRQVADLRDKLPALDRPAALCGDMNMWGPLIDGLLPGWRRAVKARTWPAPLPHSQIDHILVTPSVAGADGRRLGRTGSDHRPLRVTLTFD